MEALNIILFLGAILGTIAVIMNQAKKARDLFGFGLVMNWTFVLVVLSLGTLFFGFLEYSTATDARYSSGSIENGVVLFATSAITAAGAGFLNVKRSTVRFGVWFTFLQVIAAIGIIVPLIMIFSYFRSKSIMPQMFR
ncbi:hypothetical protein [Phaeobacter gallaeciensis]|uniref:hypothetical protein n=1 Tax=Phaeobacter gallaeciensis TaxID=60890 RepID=UPI00237F3953|nr:hypothetical protein [Phaeobacter gallaeciensis]MDE4063239.1 hypothetical protein [Phaeobacter gallaeciensis]MDE4126272.1 hypothetical protein [Phaeobacter gallaeciensis]MDE4130678.1 hypothetical protein [Phaeobacter gallaeciensis]